jgi:hypothetical protein
MNCQAASIILKIMFYRDTYALAIYTSRGACARGDIGIANELTNMAKCVQEIQWFLFCDVFDLFFAQPTGPTQLKSPKTQLLK